MAAAARAHLALLLLLLRLLLRRLLLQLLLLRLLLRRRLLEKHERDVLLAHLAPPQLRVEARLLPLRACEEHLR